MRASIWFIAAASAAGLTQSASGQEKGQNTPARSAEAKRGQYLVETIGCNDCHTPHQLTPQGPQPDLTRALSGHPEQMNVPAPPPAKGPWVAHATGTMTAWAGPWGVSYAANLTPHKETGLGSWTEKQFVQAIRTGKHMGQGRPILPPMPWPAYKNLKDEDLKAIYSYLQTLKPIANRVPSPVVAEPPAMGGSGAPEKSKTP